MSPAPQPTFRSFQSIALSAVELPLPASGRTGERFAALRSFARADPSLGRLVESHADAVAILREAGRCPPTGQALAVWASESGGKLVVRDGLAGLRIEGTKGFCGGATMIDAALVSARYDRQGVSEPILVLVDLHQPGIDIDPTSWTAPAFADAGISTVRFDLDIGRMSLVGPPAFYTNRPGFWHGAVGVAAVWAGIADALIAEAKFRSNDRLAELAHGEIAAHRWGVDAALAHAASLIDASPHADSHGVAIAARSVVATHLTEILRLLDQETGPAPIAFNPRWQQRRTELTMSILQSHGRRDILDQPAGRS